MATKTSLGIDAMSPRTQGKPDAMASFYIFFFHAPTIAPIRVIPKNQ